MMWSASVPELDSLPDEAKDEIARFTKSARRLTWLLLGGPVLGQLLLGLSGIVLSVLIILGLSIARMLASNQLLRKFPMILDAERIARAQPRPSRGSPKNFTLEMIRNFSQVRLAFLIIVMITSLIVLLLFGAFVAGWGWAR
jgi:hypothetical protein